MKSGNRWRLAGAALAVAGAGPALATDGTQLTGYGAKAQGMGGVSIALPQDSLAAANNPAGMAFIGTRFDVGAQVIGVWTDSAAFGADNDGSALAPAPEFGANWQINDVWTLGISTAGSGAQLKYDNQIITGAGNGTEGAFMAVVALPTVTYKPVENFAIGASLALAAQNLKVENFPGIPDHGREWATGAGWRVGALWNVTPELSLGATYASQIHMSSFDGYNGDLLAAVNGRMDIPEQYGVGVAYNLTSQLTVAVDYLRINWSDTQFNDVFGYRDQNVVRFGASYELNEQWTIRGGASFARRHITSDYTVQNLVLSGINSKSVHLGATRSFSNGSELTAGIEYDFGSRLEGTGASTGSFIDTKMGIISISYGRKF